MNEIKKFYIFLLVIITIISKINCYDNFIWLLESIPVLVTIPLLIFTYKKLQFTDLSYSLIFIHSVILLIGGHYTYELVPAFDYIKDIFNLSRNHYDRLGHLAQGFIPAMILRELLVRTSALEPGRWMNALIIFSILGVSASYEIIEYIVGNSYGESAEKFLGTQGDIWDTQKDMICALVGSVTSLVTLSKLQDKQLEKKYSTNLG